MRMGSFAGGLMSGIMSGMKARDWMDEKAGKEELKQLQAEQFNKVDNEGAVLAAKDADGNAYYEKVGDNQYRLKGAAAEGEATGLRDSFKLTSERDAANSYLQAAQARGLMQPMDAMKHRNAASQNELTSLQLGEAKRKASIFDGLSQIADEESAALNKRQDAAKAAEAEIAGLENPTEQIKQEIRLKHTGGLLPDDKVRFDFGLKRSRALERAGMFDEARKIHDESVSRAAVGFNRALMSGDYATAAQLYNIYPNGHQIKDIRPGAEKGQVIVTGADGKSMPMSVYDLVVSSTELVKPGTAATALMQDEKYQKMLDRLREQQQGAMERLEARLSARAAGGTGGGGGGRSRGRGGDDDESGAPSINIMPINKFSQILPEDAKPKALDAHSWYVSIKQHMPPELANNPKAETEAIRHAVNIANGTANPIATFNPKTLGWDYGVSDENGNPYSLGRNVDPRKFGQGKIDDSAYRKQANEVIAGLMKNDPTIVDQAKTITQKKLPNGLTVLEDMDRRYRTVGLTPEELRLRNAGILYQMYVEPEKGSGTGVWQSISGGKQGPASVVGTALSGTAGYIGESFSDAFNRLLESHPDYIKK